MFGKIIYILSSNSYIFGIFEDMILRVKKILAIFRILFSRSKFSYFLFNSFKRNFEYNRWRESCVKSSR